MSDFAIAVLWAWGVVLNVAFVVVPLLSRNKQHRSQNLKGPQ